MIGDILPHLLFWTFVAASVGGIVYLMHRLTAPTAQRINANIARGHYAGMAARGQGVSLPQTWRAGGLAGHDWSTDLSFKQMLRRAGPAVLAAFALGVWMRRESLTVGQLGGEIAVGFVIVGGVLLGVRYAERRRVRAALHAAGGLAPRVSFKVVANAHGLFVPIGDRVIEGAWCDWRVTAVEIDIGRYGDDATCHAMTLVHRDDPERKIPLIASTFENGQQLLEVLAARVVRID